MMQKLFGMIDAQTTIITANEGLSNYLKRQYDQFQRSQMIKTWPTLDCLPISAWWQRLWEHYLYADIVSNVTLLTKAQELMLWQKIITQSKLTSYYEPNKQLAQTARFAWEFRQKWQINYTNHNCSLNNNQSTFLHWAAQFTSLCNANNFIAPSNLIDFLTTQIKHHLIKIPPKLIGLNLIHLTKQEQCFFYQCAQVGHEVIEYHLPPNPQVVAKKILCPDQEQEIATIAQWAKNIRATDATSTVCCIMPNLSSKKATITQILSNWFDAPYDYKLNTQEPLNTQSMIQHALAFLELSSDHVPVTTISIMLHSPFIAHNTQELPQLINLDSQLRQHNYSALSPPEFVKLLRQNNCHALAKSVQKYYQLRQTQPTTQSLTNWAKIFKQLLSALNWPGDAELNHQEQTIVNCWQQFLHEAIKLTNVMHNIPYQEALTWLKIFTQETIWDQHINHANAILPILELSDLASAHGEVFSYLWVSGSNAIQDEQLTVASNPFIPYQFKVTTTEQTNLTNIKTIITSLQSASKQAVFAYDPTQTNLVAQDELILNLPTITDTNFKSSSNQSKWATIFATKKMEPITENQTLLQAQLTYAQLTPHIMAIQSICPFKAFAKLHLHAKSVPLLSAELKQSTQERILRHALQGFWQEIKDQQQLLRLPAAQLQEKITTCLHQAINKLEPNLPTNVYSQLIITKLSSIILNHLTTEKTRPFFRVLHQHKLAKLKLGNATLACKIDRIDELDQNQQIIINYTVQQHNISDWFSLRPKSLTLPAALLLKQDTCSGIAWAPLKSNKLLGLSKDQTCIPGIEKFTVKSFTNAKTWEEQVSWWHKVLFTLGEEIISGEAKVEPQESSICRKCNLPTLCRIHSKKTTAIF